MTERTHYEQSNDIGVTTWLTNGYCLAAAGAAENFYSLYDTTLAKHIPVIVTTIFGTKLVGTMTAGNIRGLLVASSVTEPELNYIKENLSGDIEVKTIDDKFNALGNCIACNDKYALIHTEMDQETEEII